MISGLISLTKRISSPICPTEKLGLVWYPFDRWMVTIFVFLQTAFLMFS